MQGKQFSLICCVLIILLASPLIAQEDGVTFDLNYLTRIHISGVRTIDLTYCAERIDYLQIQKEATNLEFENSLGLKIDYTRYSVEQIEQLLNSISSCYTDYENKQVMLPNEIYDTIIFEFPREIKNFSNIIFYLEYDLPQDTESVKVLRNLFYLVSDPIGKTSVILPENAKPWHYSSDPDNLSESNKIIEIKWNRPLEKDLFVTYGSAIEYSFYENQKNSLLNDFMIITILVFTVILSFAIYSKQIKNDRLVDSIFVFYAFILVILVIVFFFLASAQGLIPPFYNQYRNWLLIRFFIMAIIPSIAYFLIKKTK